MIDYDVWEDVPHYVLCERVIQLRAENERLRAAGDTLAIYVRAAVGLHGDLAAIDAWQEARRG